MNIEVLMSENVSWKKLTVASRLEGMKPLTLHANTATAENKVFILTALPHCLLYWCKVVGCWIVYEMDPPGVRACLLKMGERLLSPPKCLPRSRSVNLCSLRLRGASSGWSITWGKELMAEEVAYLFRH